MAFKPVFAPSTHPPSAHPNTPSRAPALDMEPTGPQHVRVSQSGSMNACRAQRSRCSQLRCASSGRECIRQCRQLEKDCQLTLVLHRTRTGPAMLRGAKIDCVQTIVPVGGPDTVQHMLSPPEYSPVVAKLLAMAQRDLARLQMEHSDVLRSRRHASRVEQIRDPRDAATEIRANAERQIRQMCERGFLTTRTRLVLEVEVDPGPEALRLGDRKGSKSQKVLKSIARALSRENGVDSGFSVMNFCNLSWKEGRTSAFEVRLIVYPPGGSGAPESVLVYSKIATRK